MSLTLLIEQDVAMEISLANNAALSWTADGSNYYTSLGTRCIVDGVRRNLTSVRIGYWEMTQAASYKQIADGTWYEDVANTRLYVNTPANYNPTNPPPVNQIVLARFKLYFSNYSIEYNGQPYANRLLLNPEDVSVRDAIDPETMTHETITAGSMTLANGDGFVDSLLTNYVLLAQSCEIAQLVGTTKTVLRKGIIGEIERTDSAVRFQLVN